MSSAVFSFAAAIVVGEEGFGCAGRGMGADGALGGSGFGCPRLDL
jgi:hypothetical protein